MKIEANLNYSEGLIKLEQGQKADQNKFQDILKLAQEEQDEAKLKEVCRDLESVFIHQMLSQMRSTIPQDGYLQSGQGEKIFQDMLDEEYSKKISHSGGMGLAEMIYRQLSQKNK